MAGDLNVRHSAFMLVPESDSERTHLLSLITPVSEWAMKTIMATLDERSADAAYNLSKSTKGSPLTTSFRSKLWEHLKERRALHT